MLHSLKEILDGSGVLLSLPMNALQSSLLGSENTQGCLSTRSLGSLGFPAPWDMSCCAALQGLAVPGHCSGTEGTAQAAPATAAGRDRDAAPGAGRVARQVLILPAGWDGFGALLQGQSLAEA